MGFLGGIFDTGAERAYDLNLENMEFIRKLYGGMGTNDPNKLFGAINQASRKAEGVMGDAVGEVRGGFDRAQTIASNIGANAQQRILDRGLQAQSQARSNLAQSGLLTSTGAANQANQTRYQTDQQLRGVDEGMAGIRSGLAAQGGQAIAGAQGNLAQTYFQRPRMLGQAAGNLGGQMGQFSFQPGMSLFQQLGGPLGYALGGGLSGLFGKKTPPEVA